MVNESFNPKFIAIKYTPTGRLNFIGAVIRYFDTFTEGFNDETKNIYFRDYNTRIFPLINPGKPLEEYDEEYIEELIRIIKRVYSYTDMTIESRYHHLLIDPCDAYYKDLSHNSSDNPLWGASYKFNTSQEDENIEATLMRIPKSFTSSQEKTASNILFNPTTDDGRLLGLATMFCCGARNNESTGANFGDISEMIYHPGYYTLRITRTSVIDSNKRKAGGKTSNAPRRLPLIKPYIDLITKRKEYICSQISFPYTENNVTYNTIDELPIACRGSRYTVPCSSSDLTRVGREFLRKDLKMREQQVSGISYLIQHSEYVLEKDPTTYLLRRNFATHLYTLGFPIEWCQYYMGHLIENDILKRSDFNDEGFLYQMALLLEKHPLNQSRNISDDIIINSSTASKFYITIENKELDDPISVDIQCPLGSADVIFSKSSRTLPTEIDITKFF